MNVKHLSRLIRFENYKFTKDIQSQRCNLVELFFHQNAYRKFINLIWNDTVTEMREKEKNQITLNRHLPVCVRELLSYIGHYAYC